MDATFAISVTATRFTDLISLSNCLLLVKISLRITGRIFIAVYLIVVLASDLRGTCHYGLRISVLWDCGRDICSIGSRNTRYGPHILEAFGFWLLALVSKARRPKSLHTAL